jgi:glycosyltransferase involved in cell wall biosynthesis
MTEPSLRIAMVTTFYPPYNFGGDGVYVQRLARALVRRGHHVEVIHDTDGYRMLSGTDPLGDGPVGPETDPEGVVIHRLRSRLAAPAALAVQQLGRPVAHAKELRELMTDRFDVIHFHNISLVGGPGIWRYGTGVKLHTAHEHWLVCESHILWRDNKELCDAKRCIRCALRHKRPPQAWRATNLIANEAPNVDAFLMLSQSAADNHHRFGFKAPMTVVPSFLPAEEAAGLPPADPEATIPPYFLFVGRLEIIKGLQDVIPHFGPDAPAELWIAGAGEYEGELRRLAEGKDKVKFLGRQPMDRLRQLYRDALAVVTPSVCYEVFPMVVLEAFRESAPIIARALGPYPEIVNETGGGLLFDDAASLKAALERLAANPAEAEAMGANGLRAFEETWSEDVALRRYFEIIRDAAARKGMVELAAKLAD